MYCTGNIHRISLERMWKDVEGLGGYCSLGAFLIARSMSDVGPGSDRKAPGFFAFDSASQRVVRTKFARGGDALVKKEGPNIDLGLFGAGQGGI